MKVLFNCLTPFALAHGGAQIQIERTMSALSEIGVETEPLRWWDDSQTGDILHYFGIPPIDHLGFAKAKGIPLIATNLFTVACNRTDLRLKLQGIFVQTALRLPFGEGIKQQLAWRSFSRCSDTIVGIEAERRVLELVYGIPHEKIAIVPLGLDEVFLKSLPSTRSADYLISAGTITRRKNSVVLARLALAAKVPILFVGKPYSESDPYWLEFKALIDNRWVLHQPHVSAPAAMVELLKSARGAVVMSDYENWCLTAHEAAACGLPVLLQNQNWSQERFGNQASYFDSIGFSSQNIEILRKFYASSLTLPAPAIRLYSWSDTAMQLKNVYEQVLLNNSL